MVFTAFHFLSIAWVKFKAEEKVDILALLFSTTLIDIEPFFGVFTGTYHGILHSFLGVTIFSALIAVTVFIVETKQASLVHSFLTLTRLSDNQPRQFRYVLMTTVFGGLSHVATDAFTHRNFAYLLFPLAITSNPFWYGFEVGRAVQVLTVLLSLYSAYLWLRKLRNQQDHRVSLKS